MNVTVFGASGGIGRLVVQQALAAGDDVRAHVRAASKLDIEHPGLTVVTSGLDDATAVEEAVAGADFVVSALGPPLGLGRRQTDLPLTAGTRTILAAMGDQGVNRYAGMATPSVKDPRDVPSAQGRLVHFLGRTMFPAAYRELVAMSRVVMDSDLDWTIARFIRPTDGDRTDEVKTGFVGADRIGAAISRADIAAFLLSQATDDRFHRAAPVIGS
jgi:uncharacterized protein YbjT (DUF2867 family)